MDLSTLLSAIVAADSGAKESNPFAPLQSASEGIGAALLQNAGNFSTSENLIGGLLAGMASGFTGNLSDNYQQKQNDLAQGLLFQAAANPLNVFERPEGMSPSVFAKLEGTGKLFALDRVMEEQKEKRLAELQTSEAINRAKALAPIERENEIAKQKALLAANREAYGPLGAIANLPPGLQDNALAQAATQEENRNVAGFIDEQFEKAKQIPSMKSLFPGTTSANEIEGIAVSLTTALQKALGREMNATEQQRLQSAIPDWNDTKEQIELKRERFKGLMETISKATPLASGSVSIPKDNRIGAGSSVSPDAALAELRRRGRVK